MSEKKTVRSMWLEFQRRVIPPNAPDIQIREMQKAFYAGFASGFEYLVDTADLPEDQCHGRLDAVNDEIMDWLADMTPASRVL